MVALTGVRKQTPELGPLLLPLCWRLINYIFANQHYERRRCTFMLLGDTIMAVNGMTVDLETVNTLLGALSNEVRL